MVAHDRVGSLEPARWERRTLSNTAALSEVVEAGFRFEASMFNIAARSAREELAQSGYTLMPLFGDRALASDAHNAFRFRRIFVDRQHGIPFLPSSEINSIRPRVEHWISRKLTRRVDRLLIRQNDVLVSCSGTIGSIGFAGRRMANVALSQDAIRIRFADEEVAGYVTAFLRTRFGRLQLRSVMYGSVIVHIEPGHLARVYVPNLCARVQSNIGRAMIEATEKRDQANDLIDLAISRMEAQIDMGADSSIGPDAKRASNCVRLSEIAGRLEGAYHDPIARGIDRFSMSPRSKSFHCAIHASSN